MMDVYPIAMQMPMHRDEISRNLPLMAAVIRSDEDLIMVDTGLPDKPALFDQLRLINLKADDFSFVINTHAHPDHIGNNRAFVNARILLSRIDYDFQKSYSNAMIAGSDPVAVLQEFYPGFRSRSAAAYAQFAQQLARRTWRDDLIGRPGQIHWIEEGGPLPSGITLIHTPGHTPGHYAVHVQAAPDKIALLISGDAMPGKLFWKRPLREIAPRFDTRLFDQSKSRIESHHGIILGGHDRPFRSADERYVEALPIRLT